MTDLKVTIWIRHDTSFSFVARADAIALLPPADLDDAYENRKYIPAADEHMAQWQQQSAAFRSNATHAAFDQPYGPALRQRYDLFCPMADRARKRSSSSSMAAIGWPFPKMTSRILPARRARDGCCHDQLRWHRTRIAEITREMVSAANTLADIASGPMRLAGHSAGGILSRMMWWTRLPPVALARLDRIVSISGLHDLRALLPLEKNASSKLDADEAAAESAICHRRAQESSWWAWQVEMNASNSSARMVSCPLSGRALRDAATQLLAKEDHFSIIAQMTDPDSQLSRLLIAACLAAARISAVEFGSACHWYGHDDAATTRRWPAFRISTVISPPSAPNGRRNGLRYPPVIGA